MGSRANGSAADDSGEPQGTRGQRFRAFVKRNRNNLILAGIFILGVLIFCYPSFSNWWNSFHQSRALMDYAQNVSEMDTAQYQALLDAAHAYNDRLAQTGQKWTMTDADQAEYNSLLNIDGTGIMGYIQIPKINVELPLYHGTDDAVLQTSIGHLAGTSLPVGGESTHSVLSGHRGLPSARLFTDLDRLEEGDTFTLTILNETLTYEVDQIRIVEPTDLSDLQIEEGQDLCTLVTCTPYGINTQRLLVRGHRVANAMGDAEVTADAFQIRTSYIAAFIAVPVVLLLFIYVLVSTDRRHRKPDLVKEWLDSEGLEKPQIPLEDDELRSQRMRRTIRGLRGLGSRGGSAASHAQGGSGHSRVKPRHHTHGHKGSRRHGGPSAGSHRRPSR